MTSCRPAPGAPAQRAFTLIEVLVALGIFALAAVVLGAAYANVLSGYAAVSGREERERTLEWVRTAVLQAPDRRAAEQGGERTLPDGRTARWSATVADTAIADLFEVTWHCTAGPSDAAAGWTRDESFFLLRPAWSDPAARERLRQQTQQRWAREAVR